MSQKRQRFAVEITTEGPVNPLPSEPAIGWSEDARVIVVEGNYQRIVLLRDGKPMVGFRIDDDGNINMTSYSGASSFEMDVERNAQFRAARKWRKEK